LGRSPDRFPLISMPIVIPAAMIPTTVIIAAMVIAPVVIRSISPPTPWPRIDIHIRVNIAALAYRSSSLSRRLAGGVDHGVEDGVTDPGVF